MDILETLISKWEGQCGVFAHGTYISDIDFEEHFHIVNHSLYITSVFEFLQGEYGLDRGIYYNFLELKGILVFNFRERQMFTLEEGPLFDDIVKNQLTIYNDTLFITSSSYLKPITFLLFTKYSYLEGLKYIFDHLIPIVSYILPDFISLKSPDPISWLSMPFSLNFIYLKNINIEYYYSQIENQVYKLCLNAN